MRESKRTFADWIWSLVGIAGIIFIIVAIGIFNALLMSVVERTREFGVMSAIGTSPGQLFALVLGEAGLLASLACAAGAAVG